MFLDKTTIDFLIYLKSKSKLSMSEYFTYFENKKINPWTIIHTFVFLQRNNYIHKVNEIIYPTIDTDILINYLKEDKHNTIFYNYVLPYIHEFFIFLLGLLSPYLIKLVTSILSKL